MKRILMGILWLLAPWVAGGETTQPNILLILSDDAGYADFSCYSDRGLKTPNIDRLAENGVRFTQGYVSASVCSPSRAGLLTGRYQQRFGHQRNIPEMGAVPSNDPDRMGLEIHQRTIADQLRNAGYRTAVIGKWHLGEARQFHPNQRGFDYFCGMLGGARSYFLDSPVRNEAQRMMRNADYIEASGYLTEFLTEEALRFMTEESDKPFFLYLSYTAPHAPMEPKPEDEAQFPEIKGEKRRKLAGMMLSLDREVGRILDMLRETGLEKNTLVIFLNDNGGPTAQNGSNNWPLRGAKGTEFEGGDRVAFMMQYKGVLPEGAVYDKPVISLDIMPTAVAVAGAELPANQECNGANLIPYVKGEQEGAPHQKLFWNRFRDFAAIDGDWKLLQTPSKAMLFNLKDDISEMHDLSEQYPERVQAMKQSIAEWQAANAEPLWDTAWTVG
ncbi:MAG: sulfatase-like hydrolase/transferase, partial [Kiritimatiellae bacterium]|nr:sulfatase-like hydrolase/transferase [Kiritimatiellia bacterium]